MKKIDNINEFKSKIKLICWDLDGTLFDTETMWYNMDKLVVEKYGSTLNNNQISKASEEIAANTYKTIGYRANADIALKYFKENNILQVIINKCDLTNKTMLNNENVNKTFALNNFDQIISEKSFDDNFNDEDMYMKALDMFGIKDKSSVVAICDMPFELKNAKNVGILTVWAKNKDYPFNEQELKDIEENADFYIEDFRDLIV